MIDLLENCLSQDVAKKHRQKGDNFLEIKRCVCHRMHWHMRDNSIEKLCRCDRMKIHLTMRDNSLANCVCDEMRRHQQKGRGYKMPWVHTTWCYPLCDMYSIHYSARRTKCETTFSEEKCPYCVCGATDTRSAFVINKMTCPHFVD